MARDLTSIVKRSRREGYALHPKAHKVLMKRSAAPGQSPQARRNRPSQYSIQLREKQKVKRIYGLLEKQFRKLLREAEGMRGQTGQTLIELLERRLDNSVYRAGFAPSRQAARQLVTHGHLVLNGTRVDIPSIRVKAGDEIVVRTKSSKNNYFQHMTELTADNDQGALSWLSADPKTLVIKITGNPLREEAAPDINEQLIVEYYSR